ncbi:MAG: hypothetical protein RL021_1385 [Bacteroidota bacterium]|jgi:5-(carboxyamino)imidazole ribonucleotide synthase
MTQSIYKSARLGILGGGQLGRMLIQEAINLNVRTSVLDPDPDAPCLSLCDRFVNGSFRDREAVLAFGRTVDHLTVEIEHVDVSALEILEKEGVIVRPASRILKLVQDKGAQKIFYRANGIPTAPFHLVSGRDEISEHAEFLPVMQKLRTGGYDGKGVRPIRNTGDIADAFDAPSVLEKFVSFEKEIAVIVARNSRGETVTYPAVEMEFNQEANLVEFLFAPARITREIEAKASQLAARLAEALELEGVLAVELFLTGDGELLVNEIAPRPHNSGHATIEANRTSQYEQHLRAVLDLPLGDTSLIQPTVMVNLLGERGHEGEAAYLGMEECLAIHGVHVHLYGKRFTKPFRKMGHVTICDDTLDQAIDKAKKVQQTLKVISS